MRIIRLLVTYEPDEEADNRTAEEIRDEVRRRLPGLQVDLLGNSEE